MKAEFPPVLGKGKLRRRRARVQVKAYPQRFFRAADADIEFSPALQSPFFGDEQAETPGGIAAELSAHHFQAGELPGGTGEDETGLLGLQIRVSKEGVGRRDALLFVFQRIKG